MQEIPDYPLFERYTIDAYRIDRLEGWIPMKGTGIWNFWTALNLHEKGKEFGGEIRVPVLQEPKTLSPFKLASAWDYFVVGLIYDTLLREDPDRELIPWMAKDWEIENLPNGTQIITFHLNEGLKWHDGEPLTAEDVAFTFEYFKEHEAPPFQPYLENMLKVKVVDDLTVKVYMNSTSAINVYNLGRMIYIIPKHIWQNVDNPEEYEPDVPIGSGQWKFVRWVHGEFIELEAFQDYFRYPPDRKVTSTTTAPQPTTTTKTVVVTQTTTISGTVTEITKTETQVVTITGAPETVTVTETAGAAPPTMLYVGIGVVVVLIALVAVLLLRRR